MSEENDALTFHKFEWNIFMFVVLPFLPTVLSLYLVMFGLWATLMGDLSGSVDVHLGLKLGLYLLPKAINTTLILAAAEATLAAIWLRLHIWLRQQTSNEVNNQKSDNRTEEISFV